MHQTTRLPGGQSSLSRRERQIVELLFRLGPSTVSRIRAAIPDPPTYSGVRGLLRILSLKGWVTHDQQGTRYVYRPTQSRMKARSDAVTQIIETFFDGSPLSLVTTLLGTPHVHFSHDELRQLQQMIKRRLAQSVIESPDR